MSRKISKQEILERYVHEVRRILGKQAPPDLTQELSSLLAESIEAREAEVGRELDLAEVGELIAAFGTPTEVAARYVPQPACLIGPGLYPAFLTVVKAVVGAAAGIPVILLVVTALAPGSKLPTFASGLANWLTLSYQIAFMGLAWAVLVFAVLERVGITTEHSKEVWDPLSLPPVNDPDRASRVGTTVRIYLVVALMILFNLYPQWVGMYSVVSGDEVRLISLRELGIRLPMLALNLWWLVALLQNLLLLKHGRWTASTRWIQFGLGICGAGIVYRVMQASAGALSGQGFKTAVGNPELAAFLARLIPSIFIGALLIVLGNSAYRLYRLFRPATA